MILVILIALAVWLFYYLQRYIVYDKDGLHLDLSAQREEILRPGTPEETAIPVHEHVDVEIVVEQRDYSELLTDAGNNLANMHAVFVPAKDVTENTLKFLRILCRDMLTAPETPAEAEQSEVLDSESEKDEETEGNSEKRDEAAETGTEPETAESVSSEVLYVIGTEKEEEPEPTPEVISDVL